MVFWDKACAYAQVRDMLQSKSAEPLGLRKLEQNFAELGLTIHYTKLGIFLYAVDNLSALGKFCTDLSLAKTAELRKQHNELLAQRKEAGYVDDMFVGFWEEVLSEWVRQTGDAKELDVPGLQHFLQRAFDITFPVGTEAEDDAADEDEDGAQTVTDIDADDGNNNAPAPANNPATRPNTETVKAETPAASSGSLPLEPVNPVPEADIPAAVPAAAVPVQSAQCPCPYSIPPSREAALKGSAQKTEKIVR